jgi:hypothetical protein
MLYAASAYPIALRASHHLSVEPVEESRQAVRQWFTFPNVVFLGAHTGCSCGFPSVIAEEPIEYFEGFFDDDRDREANLASVKALFALIESQLGDSPLIELLPVADLCEGKPPKGLIELRFADLDPGKFFFTEQFLYRISGDATPPPSP